MNSRLVPAIAVLVVVVDGALLATGVISPATALALFLAVVIPLGMITVRGYVRRYRECARTARSRREALRALAADDPYLRMMATEARTFASLGRWVARRPDVPEGAVAIGYSRGTLGIPVAIAVAAGIELVAVHLLVLRSGPYVCARVPLNTVAEVRRERRLQPTAGEIVDDDGTATLTLPGPDGTSLSMRLDRPVAAGVPAFPWSRPEPREVTTARLHVDDPDDARRVITASTPTPHR